MAVQLYFILGNAGAHRRAVLTDLIAEGLTPADRAAVLLSTGEAPVEADAALERTGAVVARWRWLKPEVDVDVPEGVTHLFLVADGRSNPVDQVEGLREWLLMRADVQLARVIFMADAALLHAKPELARWFDACAHYSDVLLLTRAEGIDQKWINALEARYRDQHYPFLFEVARKDVLKNPAVILVPEARRVSQVFDEDIPLADETDEEMAAAMAENDFYFVRTRGGTRVQEIPNIAAYLPAGGAK